MNDRQNFLCVCNNGKQYIREVSWRIIMYLFNYDFYDHQRYWFAANLCQCFCAIPAQIFNSLNCLTVSPGPRALLVSILPSNMLD